MKSIENKLRKQKKEETRNEKSTNIEKQLQLKDEKTKALRLSYLDKNNIKKQQRKEKIISQQLRSQRNERIRERRAMVLTMRAEIDSEKNTKRKEHFKQLQLHRKEISLNAWRRID